jgi:hypothetical protein
MDVVHFFNFAASTTFAIKLSELQTLHTSGQCHIIPEPIIPTFQSGAKRTNLSVDQKLTYHFQVVTSTCSIKQDENWNLGKKNGTILFEISKNPLTHCSIIPLFQYSLWGVSPSLKG